MSSSYENTLSPLMQSAGTAGEPGIVFVGRYLPTFYLGAVVGVGIMLS